MLLLVIVGINGRRGTSVANAFLENKQFRIRGLTSSPGCSASRNWRTLGVEIREETFVDENSVRENFFGAAIIFASTNYDKYFKDRGAKLACSLCPNMDLHSFAAAHEVNTGKTIISAAANTPGLGRFVLATLPTLPPNANFATEKGEWQYRAQAELVKYLTSDHDTLNKKTTLVKPAFRMEDFLKTLRMKDDGTLSCGLSASGYIRLPWINMNADFGSLVHLLAVKSPPGTTIAAFSESIAARDVCEHISKISGIMCQFRKYSLDDMDDLGGHIVTDLLPIHPRDTYYESNIIPPSHLAEHLKQDVPMTSFEEYLKGVLPDRIKALKQAAIDGEMDPAAIKIRQEADEEEYEDLRQVERQEVAGGSQEDVFMGYPWSYESMKEMYRDMSI
ncbi:hypothetical protein N0V90_005081 [Kalmusia sp. IMI 367209]|nr:hypothetical protein N0V90_005081 [Kalmusia sp. IMI 367209]